MISSSALSFLACPCKLREWGRQERTKKLVGLQNVTQRQGKAPHNLMVRSNLVPTHTYANSSASLRIHQATPIASCCHVGCNLLCPCGQRGYGCSNHSCFSGQLYVGANITGGIIYAWLEAIKIRHGVALRAWKAVCSTGLSLKHCDFYIGT